LYRDHPQKMVFCVAYSFDCKSALGSSRASDHIARKGEHDEAELEPRRGEFTKFVTVDMRVVELSIYSFLLSNNILLVVVHRRSATISSRQCLLIRMQTCEGPHHLHHLHKHQSQQRLDPEPRSCNRSSVELCHLRSRLTRTRISPRASQHPRNTALLRWKGYGNNLIHDLKKNAHETLRKCWESGRWWRD
jgi:hypothetical protein